MTLNTNVPNTNINMYNVKEGKILTGVKMVAEVE